MGISTKNRRRIVVDDREYIWWVAVGADDAFDDPTVRVATVDRRFLVHYHLRQPDETRHMTVLGPEFKGVPGAGVRHRRFLSPAFGTPEAMRPADVAALIRWCRDTESAPVEVDWHGKPLVPVMN
ncbi:hypothetical protein [Nocardia sp. NPDC050710]|uniref:hypothetical protein n=1 Tax=Nocardia sp. NPDC050710 TaxID=3157220 RepID=UPI003400E0D0